MVEINLEIKKLIESNALAFATVGSLGKPHCIAVGFVKVVSENELILTDNYMLETVKNIQLNSSVALTVWNQDWKEKTVGFELKGIAEYFLQGKWFDFVKKIPENKGEPCKGAILITVKKIKRLA
ncbi:MAG: pyridoxamine 5'-phosphate oxidase family protein [archaeon]